MEMAVCEWVHMQELDFSMTEFFNLVPRWDKCVSVIGECINIE
jgi:hypothetical protein